MAPTKETYVYLCHCDKLCDLNEVEELLKAVEKKLAAKTSFKIEKGYFSGGQISDMVDKTIPKLKMDYAVFVVHARECCLSFSEDSNLGKIYEALKKRTGSGRLQIYLLHKLWCGIPNSSRYSLCVVSRNLCRVILLVQDSQLVVLHNQRRTISTDFLKQNLIIKK